MVNYWYQNFMIEVSDNKKEAIKMIYERVKKGLRVQHKFFEIRFDSNVGVKLIVYSHWKDMLQISQYEVVAYEYNDTLYIDMWLVVGKPVGYDKLKEIWEEYVPDLALEILAGD